MHNRRTSILCVFRSVYFFLVCWCSVWHSSLTFRGWGFCFVRCSSIHQIGWDDCCSVITCQTTPAYFSGALPVGVSFPTKVLLLAVFWSIVSLFVIIAEELCGKSYLVRFFVFFSFIDAESRLVCIICRGLHGTRKSHTLPLNGFRLLRFWLLMLIEGSTLIDDLSLLSLYLKNVVGWGLGDNTEKSYLFIIYRQRGVKFISS